MRSANCLTESPHLPPHRATLRIYTILPGSLERDLAGDSAEYKGPLWNSFVMRMVHHVRLDLFAVCEWRRANDCWEVSTP